MGGCSRPVSLSDGVRCGVTSARSLALAQARRSLACWRLRSVGRSVCADRRPWLCAHTSARHTPYIECELLFLNTPPEAHTYVTSDLRSLSVAVRAARCSLVRTSVSGSSSPCSLWLAKPPKPPQSRRGLSFFVRSAAGAEQSRRAPAVPVAVFSSVRGWLSLLSPAVSSRSDCSVQFGSFSRARTRWPHSTSSPLAPSRHSRARSLRLHSSPFGCSSRSVSSSSSASNPCSCVRTAGS